MAINFGDGAANVTGQKMAYLQEISPAGGTAGHGMRLFRARSWLALEWSRFGLFWMLFLSWFALTIIASQVNGDAIFESFWVYFRRIVAFFTFLPMVLSITFLGAFVVRRDRSIAGTASWFAQSVLTGPLAGRLMVSALTFPVFMGCFLYWKMKIPLFQPFSWDETFAQWDAFLLGGRQAWDVLQPWIGTPGITRFIDIAYSLWALVCAGFWIYLFTAKRVPLALRDQYWMAVLLSWLVIGLMMATALSSAGPVYYSLVTGDHDLYAPMRTYFSGFDGNLIPDDNLVRRGLVATTLQNMLWGIHAGWLDGTGGISAMPSMHNAQALLFVLAGFKLARWLGWLMAAFAAIIFTGSVHLGWHYMVDGLIAFALVLPIWHFSGWLARRQTP